MEKPFDNTFLSLNKEFLASLINTDDLYTNAPCGYLSFHPDGTIIKINRTLCEWLQHPEFDILYKMNFTDLLSKGGIIYYEMFYLPLLKMQGFVNEINFDIKRADGTFFPTLVNSVVIEDKHGEIRAINVTIFNITDRKKYERELLDAKKEADTEKKRFQLLADITPDIIFTSTPEGVIEYANKRFFDYFNIAPAELNQRRLMKKLHEGDKIRCFRQWMLAVKKCVQFETEVRLKNAHGKYVWHLVRAVPYTDDNTNILKFFGSCTNIQEQKIMQGKNDEFISFASHELKTPLASLKGYIQILQKEKTDPFFASITDRCTKAVNSMQYLIGNLLDVSRIHTGQMNLYMEKASLYSMLMQSLEFISTNQITHDVQLVYEADANLMVNMDVQRIQQVVINLLSNAIKYSPRGSSVILKAEQMPEQHRVCISVQDFGIGISPEQKRMIFEKYFRVKDTSTNSMVSGLGIGLYITKQIVKLHNSNISVESEVNKGSRFSFYLPAV